MEEGITLQSITKENDDFAVFYIKKGAINDNIENLWMLIFIVIQTYISHW